MSNPLKITPPTRGPFLNVGHLWDIEIVNLEGFFLAEKKRWRFGLQFESPGYTTRWAPYSYK